VAAHAHGGRDQPVRLGPDQHRAGRGGGLQAGGGGIGISILCFLFVAFISALELLVAAIQAYVFAILTSLYINDAVNLH